MTDQSRIDQIRKELEGTTPGEWEPTYSMVREKGGDWRCWIKAPCGPDSRVSAGYGRTKEEAMKNAQFIANSKRHIAFLLAKLKVYEEALDKIQYEENGLSWAQPTHGAHIAKRALSQQIDS